MTVSRVLDFELITPSLGHKLAPEIPENQYSRFGQNSRFRSLAPIEYKTLQRPFLTFLSANRALEPDFDRKPLVLHVGPVSRVWPECQKGRPIQY